MTNFKEQLEFITRINFGWNNHTRLDCPFCGGKNTLSIGRLNKYLRWNCFKANCDVKGVIEYEPTKKDINESLLTPKQNNDWDIPQYFTSLVGHEEAYNILQSNNSFEAYVHNRADIRYDPKLNRMVFIIKNNGVIFGGIGRRLSKNVSPKWHKYNASIPYPLIVQPISSIDQDTVILVEDAFSACAVSNADIYGVALLGTTLFESYIPTIIKRFKIVWVALDKDATKKAIKIQRILSSYVDARVLPIQQDLKYCNENQIKGLMR